MLQKCEGLVSFLKSFRKIIQEEEKKNVKAVWDLPAKFTANPANFHPNSAELAVLFSSQILNCSNYFFSLPGIIFLKFFMHETI